MCIKRLSQSEFIQSILASVFSPSCVKENYSIVLADIKLSDVKLSLENLSPALKRCPISNAVSYDLLPSSLLRKCYECLTPFVYILFQKLCLVVCILKIGNVQF